MKLVMLLVVLSGLVGCAGSSSSLVRADGPNNKLDEGKIAAVNTWAHDHGATVIWIHMPTKAREDLAKAESP